MNGTSARVGPASRGLLALAGVLAVAVSAVTLDWRLLVPIGLGLPLVAVVVRDEVSWDRAAAGAPSPVDLPGVRASGIAGHGLLQREALIAAVWALWFFRLHITLFAVPGTGVMLLRSGVRAIVHVLPLVIVMSALLEGSFPRRIPRPALLLGGFTVFAVASATWSPIPSESIGRAYQWGLFAGLTAYCASRAVAELGFADRLLMRFLRYVAGGALVLSAWGAFEGFLGQARFTWPGQHPNTAAALLLVPCVGLLFHPRRSAITWPIPSAVVVVGLAVLTHATGSRTAVAAGIVAVVAAWFISATRDSRLGALGIGTGLVLTATVVGFAAEQLSRWVHRGQSAEAVAGLNGRMEVWQWVLANPFGSEVWGVGVGATRRSLPVSWDAAALHSAWLDLLQSVGVIGLALMGGVVAAVLTLVVVRRSVHAAWMMGFVLVVSLAELGFAHPAYSLVLLCLAIIVVSDARLGQAQGSDPATSGDRPAGSPSEPDPSRAGVVLGGAEQGR